MCSVMSDSLQLIAGYWIRFLCWLVNDHKLSGLEQHLFFNPVVSGDQKSKHSLAGVSAQGHTSLKSR